MTVEWDRKKLGSALAALRAGPMPEWSDHGPERGQDYYRPAESYTAFYMRVLDLFKDAAPMPKCPLSGLKCEVYGIPWEKCCDRPTEERT